MEKLALFISFVFFNICVLAQTAPGDILSRFRGNNGMTFTFTTTGSRIGNVWGGANGVYTDDSKLGKAAVHAGLLGPGETGTVNVIILPGMGSYWGNTRNGISTNDRRAFSGSFQFGAQGRINTTAEIVTYGPAETIPETIYDAPPNLKEFTSENSKVFTFRVTGSKFGKVWGGANGIYTDDSDLGTAAVHAGKLMPGEQAIIKIRVVKGQMLYPGVLRNGIFSEDSDGRTAGFKFE